MERGGVVPSGAEGRGLEMEMVLGGWWKVSEG